MNVSIAQQTASINLKATRYNAYGEVAEGGMDVCSMPECIQKA